MRFLFPAILALAPLFGEPDGERIYRELCAECHGENGEGEEWEYDEPLTGNRSVASLAKLIAETMPEDDEEAVVGADAEAVAAYIHQAFYSPEAQNRLHPARVELVRLTRPQYLHSVADLVNSFQWKPEIKEERGLKAEWFNSHEMNKTKDKLKEGVETRLFIDLETSKPHENLKPEKFYVRWQGSLLPPRSGDYHFRLTSPNGVRLFVNSDDREEGSLIDGYVSSKNESRELTGKTFLLAGHPVPFQIDFYTYEEKKAALKVEWKPPLGVWEEIPEEFLIPEGSPALTLVTAPFPPDDASLGYERGSSVSKAWADAVSGAAIEATQSILANLERLAKTKPGDGDRAAKLKDFAHQFAERAFGRPLTDEQKESHVERFFRDMQPDEALKRTLLLSLTSPRFLYPALNRAPDGKADQFSIAAHLSLALTDSSFDRELYEAAKKGELKDEGAILWRFDRLLESPLAAAKMNRFFYHWLGLEERKELGKDPKTFPGFDEFVVADLRSSLDHFIDQTVWSEASDYRQLFLSDQLFLTPRLQEFYGTEKKPDRGLSPVRDERRAGLLTHPYLLAAFAYHQQTSPIHRGVYLSRNVLGRFLKPPPEAVQFEDSHFDPHATMREKVTELTKKDSCMACHAVINPVGFSLENFDAVGRFRDTEKDKPINTTSLFPLEDTSEVKISGPEDLARLAIESPTAHRAFLRQLFEHLVQQSPLAYSPELLEELREKFIRDNFSIRRIMVEITLATLPKTDS